MGVRPHSRKGIPALAGYREVTATWTAGKIRIVVQGVFQSQAGYLGGSRNPAAATDSGCVRSAESGCFPRARLNARNVGVSPGETQDARKVGVSPGEMIVARKTVIPRAR